MTSSNNSTPGHQTDTISLLWE